MLFSVLVAPHGDEIINPTTEDMKKLNYAMQRASKSLKGADIFIVISPHNIRIDTQIGIILTENLRGSLKVGNKRIRRTYHCDRDLSGKIYRFAKSINLPVVGVNFGALEGPLSCMPLDWGSLIPLYFLPKKPSVLITPARAVSREKLIKFGEVLGEVLESDSRKISLVVSADHAHTHSRDGPYGYSTYAKCYDEIVLKSLKEGNLSPLLEISDAMLEDAKPDSYWQLLMLHGLMKKVKLQMKFVEYAVASYFGMAVAYFTRG